MDQADSKQFLDTPFVLGVDVSRWQEKVDWKTLKDNGIEFVFIKASQGNYLRDIRLEAHLDGAHNAGLIAGVYHWVDPLVGGESQAQYFLNATRNLKYSFIAADVEQYWADWSQWGRSKITSYLQPDRIADCMKMFLENVDTQKDVPLIIYTRANFINYYAAPALSWIGDYDLWLANYPFSVARVKLNWEELKAQYHLPPQGPPLPRGCTKWTFWQFSGDKFILPGVTSPLDVNVFNGSLAEFRKFAKIKPIPVPEPPKPPTPPPPPKPTIEQRLAKLEAEARKKGWKI